MSSPSNQFHPCLEMRSRRPDWSALPADVIEVISNLIKDDADFVRFRSVCAAWRSAAPRRPLIPWLLLLYDGGEADNLGLCNFPSTEFSSCLRLPQIIIREKVICGSSSGWIAMLDDTPAISLHNPFTAVHIDLPPLTNLPWITKSNESFLQRHNIYSFYQFERHNIYSFYQFARFCAKKLVLSSDPTVAPYVAVALSNNNGRLIYCQSGDISWTALPSFVKQGYELDDIIFYRGNFYVVQTYRVFLLCDIGSENPHVTEILPAEPLFSDGNEREELSHIRISYLVDCSGDLLLVAIIVPHLDCDDPGCDDCDNFSFDVFRVDLNERMSLVKLDTLGGRSIFMGCGSMSVSAPDSSRCRGNCIYFLPDIEDIEVGEWEDKIVVFSMEDGNVSAFSDERIDNWEMHWLTPSLC